jgi:hypothetical protein
VTDQVREGGEAAHDDDPDRGMGRAQRGDEIAAALARGQEVVDKGDVEAAGDRQRAGDRVGGDHVEACALQARPGRPLDQSIVVHHQDALAPPVAWVKGHAGVVGPGAALLRDTSAPGSGSRRSTRQTGQAET